jgi:UDP-N-acetylmuramoyl-tripeptide--D-alanyl-D-alanine ligase
MIPLTVAEIAELTGGTVYMGETACPGHTAVSPLPADTAPADTVPADAVSADTMVTGTVVTGPVVTDSREAVAGALFAALPGEHADGHAYAALAVEKGAAAVLGARPLPEAGVPVVVVPDVVTALGLLARGVLARLPGAVVVGITGSSGKTSTKDLTAQVVEHLGPTIAPEGSFNNEIGVPMTVLRADQSTRYLVLEMAARGIGHIAYLCGIAPPKISAVLNVGRAHAGEFGSIEAVAKAKGELVEPLPSAADGGVAILNADDPNVAAMAARTSARVVTFSVAPVAGEPVVGEPVAGEPVAGESGRPADVRATDISLDELGRASFGLIIGGGRADVTLRLHGAHHVANALAAAAVASELGLGAADIAAALSGATARSKKRMELHETPDGIIVVNDAYNANPDSTRAAIEALAQISGHGQRRRGFAVLGYMAELGEIETESHVEAGRQAARSGATAVIAVGDGAAPVLDGARATAGWHGEAIAVPHPRAAVQALRDRLRPGDVVLVKASKAAGLWEVADGLLAEVDQ